MKVVAREFEHQGYQMKGPCAALASGKHKGNVARDVQRDFARRHLDPVALQLKWKTYFIYMCMGPQIMMRNVFYNTKNLFG
jgi:hypothetical protein